MKYQKVFNPKLTSSNSSHSKQENSSVSKRTCLWISASQTGCQFHDIIWIAQYFGRGLFQQSVDIHQGYWVALKSNSPDCAILSDTYGVFFIWLVGVFFRELLLCMQQYWKEWLNCIKKSVSNRKHHCHANL